MPETKLREEVHADTRTTYEPLDVEQMINLPKELQNGKRFVCWREAIRGARCTKVPVNPFTGKDAKSDNAATWSTLDEAIEFYRAHRSKLQGVGRMFDPTDRLIGVDFDDCLDDYGEIIPGHAAEMWLSRLDSYTEVSPSGRGVKLWVRASHDLGGKSGRRDAKQGVEVYRERRYFTLTGKRLEQFCGRVESRELEFSEFYSAIFGAKKTDNPKPEATSTKLADAEIISRAGNAKNGDKFKSLWSGRFDDCGSQSEADAALCSLLWFWSGDRETVRRLFGQSALGQRDKWQRVDYQKSTLDLACQGEVYSPNVIEGAEQFTYGAGQFQVSENGVYYLGRDKEGNPKPPLWLCGRLTILAQTRDDKSAAWGRLLEWRDNDKVVHRWAMPNELLQGDGAEVRFELARLGLSIAPTRPARESLLTYLQTWPVDRRARCVESLGWHGPVYVVPSETIGEAEEHVVFQNAHAIEPAFSTSSTTKEWRDQVAAMAQGNSRLVFALSVAFAGPLIEPAGEDSGGFHLRGASSTGKSTVLKLAASVWGNPSAYCRLWRATTNGLEGLAALHNDGVLILDELGQIDPREAGESAYMLANGRGKARAARNGTARPSATWRLLLLSAGEESLTALMAQVGRKPTAGQEIRLADFDADAGCGMGAFESLNGFESSAALVAALKEAAIRYYGSVGEAWLRWLVEQRSKLATFISDGVRQFVREHAPNDASGQVERVARRYGLVAVAGELATHAGLTGWQQGEAEQAAGKCFAAWQESFGGSTGNREERALLAQVKVFFELYGESRFEATSSTSEQRVNSRAGFFRSNAEGPREYLVLPQVFKSEVCKGFELKAAVKVLRTHGWLIPASDNKTTQKPRLPEIGPTRVYVIGGKMWEHEE